MVTDILVDFINGELSAPRLMLRPETDKDRRTLERLVVECDRIAGLGRDPRTGELIHVSIASTED